MILACYRKTKCIFHIRKSYIGAIPITNITRGKRQLNHSSIRSLNMSKETHQPARPPRIAFISGHIDLTQDTFDQNYRAPLDDAIAAGDSFIVSSSRGADTLALDYLLTANVSTERITTYLNTPLPPKAPPKRSNNKAKNANSSPNQTNRRDPDPSTIQKYEDVGVNVKLVSGDHTKRDTVMTRESDYDILWVRPEAETRTLYGSKWRPGRVSGTEKNRLRRDVVMVGRRGIGDVGDDGAESRAD